MAWCQLTHRCWRNSERESQFPFRAPPSLGMLSLIVCCIIPPHPPRHSAGSYSLLLRFGHFLPISPPCLVQSSLPSPFLLCNEPHLCLPPLLECKLLENRHLVSPLHVEPSGSAGLVPGLREECVSGCSCGRHC